MKKLVILGSTGSIGTQALDIARIRLGPDKLQQPVGQHLDAPDLFVDQPQFNGTALPPTYAGKSQAELNGLMASVTNTIWVTNSAAYTNLDNSPELRSHVS